MRYLLCGFIFITLIACKEAQSPTQIEPIDAGSVQQDGSALVPDDEPSLSKIEQRCSAACGQLTRLGCPEALPITTGDSCSVLCVKMERTKKMTLKPECIAKSNTLKELAACGTVRCIVVKSSGAE